MGYAHDGVSWRHPRRTAVFVGDLIDRGPDQLATLRLARAMVDAGAALIVMGNHEFNAIGWATPDGRGGRCREHSEKNRDQHHEFLEAVGEGSSDHDKWIAWFRTLPLWLDLDGLHVVHACWDERAMATLGSPFLTDEVIAAASGSPAFEAVEVLLKGPEIPLGGDLGYLDKDGHPRDKARFRWWDPDVATLRAAAEIPGDVTALDGSAFGPLPDSAIDRATFPAPPDGVPVVFGHYWRNVDHAALEPCGPRAVCVDWSVAKKGPLVAYRWNGERDLPADHFVSVPA